MDKIEHRFVAGAFEALPIEPIIGQQRSYLTDSVTGRVLDLGAGTGSMFSHFDSVDGDESIDVHAVEPDPHMRSYANGRANAYGVELVGGRGEALPYRSDSFDVVIVSLAFCTIAQPERTLDEIARVLKVGGELRFLEHVRADGIAGDLQRYLTPIWKRLAGGCHLDRSTESVIASHPSFEVIDIERSNVGVFPVNPFIRGRVRKRA